MMDGMEMATVTAQDPNSFGVFVSLDRLGGQGPTLPVQVGTPGPRDGTVFKGKAGLPTAGTRGLVSFPRGDARNGVWICAVGAGLVDASSFASGLGGLGYDAHYGGGWSWLGPDGTLLEATPDGSLLRLGPTVAAPTRHVLTGNQAQQTVAFAEGQRVATPPADPFPLSVTLASGIQVVGTPQGALTVTAAAGQVLTLVCGSTTLTLDGGSGTATIAVGAVSVEVSGTSGDITATNGAATLRMAGSVVTVTKVGGSGPLPVKLSDGSNSSVLLADR